MDLKEERNMILDMIAEGKITVEEAKQLLDALEKSTRTRPEEDEFFGPRWPHGPGNVHKPHGRMPYGHIPHVADIPDIPDISRIVEQAYAEAMPDMVDELANLNDVRSDLQEEINRMQAELDSLKVERKRRKDSHGAAEDWDE